MGEKETISPQPWTRHQTELTGLLQRLEDEKRAIRAAAP